jgi:hypothetical protein
MNVIVSLTGLLQQLRGQLCIYVFDNGYQTTRSDEANVLSSPRYLFDPYYTSLPQKTTIDTFLDISPLIAQS